MKVKKCPESAQVVKQIASGSSIHASLPEKEPKITMTECLSFPRARKARHCVFFCSFRTLSDLEALPADSAKRPTQLVEIRKSVSAEIFPACPRVGVWLFLSLSFSLLLSASLTLSAPLAPFILSASSRSCARLSV